MKSFKFICSTILLFLLFGCKTTKTATTEIKKKIPSTYLASSDSVSMPPINWKNLFFDKHLIALIDSALIYNYDLKIALQKIEVSRAGLKSTRGIRLPELSLALGAGQRKFGDYTADGVGNYDTQFSPNINSKQQIPSPLPDYYGAIQASWEIDFWGKLKNKKKAALSRFIASQYGKSVIITNLVAEIAATYYEILNLDNELRILSDNITLRQSALEIVNIQKQTANANELAVEMIHAQLLNSQAAMAEVKQKLVEEETKLSFLRGGFPTSIIRDTSRTAATNNFTLPIGIPSDLLLNRPDIRQAEMELKASDADVKSAKAAFYPSINISGAMGLQAFNAALLLETPASLAYNIMGGLTAPLINRRKIKADLMAARASQKQAYIQYEKTVTSSFIEVYNSLQNIENTKEMYALKQQETEILSKSVITSTELFKAGRAGYLEIIISQKNALQSQIELANYKKRKNTTLINLYRATGGGWQ